MIEIIGFFFIVILGTLCHFIYDWSNHNKFIAYFCAVNESTWEHIKLAIGPTFLWILIEIPFIGQNTNFTFAKAISLITMIIIIPTFFYLYTSILKKDNFIIDITIFILAIFFGQLFSYFILILPKLPFIINYISIILIVIVFIYYMTRTFLPHKSPLFKDPINQKYGLDAHQK